jgi:hypothetical protein
LERDESAGQADSRAKAILTPVMRKVETEDGGRELRVTGFKLENCLFTVSDTEDDELPEVQPVDWSRERALGALAVEQVAFDSIDGNLQGYSMDRRFAVNPVAAYPFKTMLHEVGHIVLGHTAAEEAAECRRHRGVKEFQAEGTAYLVGNELEAQDQMDTAERRAYIQHWLQGDAPDDKAIKAVFAATTAILKAGREVV